MTQTTLTINQHPISKLHLDPRNARVHGKAQIKQIARSIESFGFNVPVLVDEAGKIIAGHGRVVAAQLLGWQEVPTISLAHLTPEIIAHHCDQRDGGDFKGTH